MGPSTSLLGRNFTAYEFEMGKRVRLSNGRRLVDDVIRIACKMPMAALAGDYEAPMVAKFRRRTHPKISWNVLYLKAYAIVCAQNPELRRAYVSFPWGHMYEHDRTVGMMTIAREHEGEERLFFARFNSPEQESLADLQEHYDHYRTAPIKEIKQFRHQIAFAHTPKLIRRFAWWFMFNLWPQKRAAHMGTFGMSFSGYKGAYGSKHLGPNTTILGVDPTPRKGIGRVLLTFDHRVVDGTPVTRAMQQTNRMLNTAIKVELAEMIGVNPKSGEDLSEPELIGLQKRLKARKIETIKRKEAEAARKGKRRAAA